MLMKMIWGRLTETSELEYVRFWVVAWNLVGVDTVVSFMVSSMGYAIQLLGMLEVRTITFSIVVPQ